MSYLVICSLSDLYCMIDQHKPNDIISIIDCRKFVKNLKNPNHRHLILNCNDIEQPKNNLLLPNKKHVINLLNFTKSWNQKSPLLIHCLLGISRSTAAAFIISCALNPHVDEFFLAKYLRKKSPQASPNKHLIKIADNFLNRKNRMNKAIKEIGPGKFENKNPSFIFSIKNLYNF